MACDYSNESSRFLYKVKFSIINVSHGILKISERARLVSLN